MRHGFNTRGLTQPVSEGRFKGPHRQISCGPIELCVSVVAVVGNVGHVLAVVDKEEWVRSKGLSPVIEKTAIGIELQIGDFPAESKPVLF